MAVNNSDYECIGGVGEYHKDKSEPSLSDFSDTYCINKKYLIAGELGDMTWTNKGGRGKFDGSVWAI